MSDSRERMTAIDFYNQHQTNVVNVPRVGHPEDPSGWAGVRRASEAKYIADDCPVMPLSDACEFADKFAESKIAELTRQRGAAQEEGIKLLKAAENGTAANESLRAELEQTREALQLSLIPLAALVVSGECVNAPTGLAEEVKQAIIKAHDAILALSRKEN